MLLLDPEELLAVLSDFAVPSAFAGVFFIGVFFADISVGVEPEPFEALLV